MESIFFILLVVAVLVFLAIAANALMKNIRARKEEEIERKRQQQLEDNEAYERGYPDRSK